MQTSRLAAQHLIIGLAVLMAAAAMQAQETRGTIRGRIVDSSGAVIPNVKVGATNLATNVTVSTSSNGEGNYEIPFLLPGRYRLNAELTGFKAYRRDGVEVRIGDRLRWKSPCR